MPGQDLRFADVRMDGKSYSAWQFSMLKDTPRYVRDEFGYDRNPSRREMLGNLAHFYARREMGPHFSYLSENAQRKRLHEACLRHKIDPEGVSDFDGFEGSFVRARDREWTSPRQVNEIYRAVHQRQLEHARQFPRDKDDNRRINLELFEDMLERNGGKQIPLSGEFLMVRGYEGELSCPI